MKLTVRLFAVARELVGENTIALDLPNEATIADLKTSLIEHVPELATMVGQLRFAVNEAYAQDETVITEVDDVACIPPVSGG